MVRKLINALKHLCINDLCIDNWIFKFVGVKPYNRKFRDHIDWLYLMLWIASMVYQALLLVCFFAYPNSSWFSEILDAMFDTYFAAISGYGIFNAVYRYQQNNRRLETTISMTPERRKKRNGERFVIYWWINFFVMLIAIALLDYPANISGPIKTSFKIALSSSGIWFGYMFATKWRYFLNNTDH